VDSKLKHKVIKQHNAFRKLSLLTIILTTTREQSIIIILGKTIKNLCTFGITAYYE